MAVITVPIETSQRARSKTVKGFEQNSARPPHLPPRLRSAALTSLAAEAPLRVQQEAPHHGTLHVQRHGSLYSPDSLLSLRPGLPFPLSPNQTLVRLRTGLSSLSGVTGSRHSLEVGGCLGVLISSRPEAPPR